MTAQGKAPCLLALGVSHRTATLALLEQLSLDPGGAVLVLRRLGSDAAIQEAAVLSTCNRTEIYLVGSDIQRAERGAKAALSSSAGTAGPALPDALRSYTGVGAARHLFRVTAGLESMVVGETEIQGQVKRAYDLALAERATGPIINRLFRSALEAGKRARSQAGGVVPSLASLGVDLALRRLGTLGGSRVLVIGAGQNAEATARALALHRVRPVFVASRRYGSAVGLARRFGGRAVDFQSLGAELAAADLAFSCTASREPIVARRQLAELMALRPGRDLLLVDSAVPRDIDPAVRDLAGVELYDIDDIRRQSGADRYVDSPATTRAAALVEQEGRRFQEWLTSLDVVPAISALRAHGEAAVKQALTENELRWEALSPRDRERVELVARTVAGRLLHAPTMTLREAAGSHAAENYVRVVNDLLGAGRPARAASAQRISAGGR